LQSHYTQFKTNKTQKAIIGLNYLNAISQGHFNNDEVDWFLNIISRAGTTGTRLVLFHKFSGLFHERFLCRFFPSSSLCRLDLSPQILAKATIDSGIIYDQGGATGTRLVYDDNQLRKKSNVKT
jgi:hypothetical protein